MTPRLRPCGIPECRICRWNDETHHDSGHVAESEPFAVALVGMAAIVLLFVLTFVVLPVMT